MTTTMLKRENKNPKTYVALRTFISIAVARKKVFENAKNNENPRTITEAIEDDKNVRTKLT